MRHLTALFCALFLLSACDSTQSLTELKHATPSADAFQSTLAADYKTYAEEKLAAYQWWTSKYFADKGLLAAYGNVVLPEDPIYWDLPDNVAREMTDARDQLLEALPQAKGAQPAAAAHALVAFDRWIVLAENGWDTPNIDEARDRFYTLLGSIATAESTPKAAPTAVETTSTVLYFPFDSATLSGSASMALEQLIAYVKNAGNVGITINGHADRAGTDEYNMTLSEERSKFVRAALLRAGVPDHLVHYFAFGESDPEVPTEDGIAEPLNRRVEIFIE